MFQLSSFGEDCVLLGEERRSPIQPHALYITLLYWKGVGLGKSGAFCHRIVGIRPSLVRSGGGRSSVDRDDWLRRDRGNLAALVRVPVLGRLT